jgi:phage terminase small subunit
MQRRPEHLKALTGTARPDRAIGGAVVAAPMNAPPEPPSWLKDAAALEEWHRLAPRLIACRLLTDSMTTTLAHLCAAHGAIVAIYERNEEPRAALIAQYARLAGEFGLTPISSSKIGSAAPRTENKFVRFRAAI